MPARLEAADFVRLGGAVPIVDVRSEGEFTAGHIPGAISMPLFNNAERAEIGTLYKQQGQQLAILKGLEYAGARMSQMATRALELAQNGKIAVHCWRGGMRSGSVAWLFERVGLEVSVLIGGYKAFRRACRAAFAAEKKLYVIGGKTGSQKTRILSELGARGVQVVDLEALANHRGSAFGYAPSGWQPTQEQFENELGMQLMLSDLRKPLLVEDESRLVGRMHIPAALWAQMRLTRVFVLEWPIEERVKFLCAIYQAPDEVIAQNLHAIRKRLGPERHQKASEALAAGDRAEVCRITLDYYDRAYLFGLSKRDPETITALPGDTAVEEIQKRIASAI